MRNSLIRKLKSRLSKRLWPGSANYWEARYQSGGNSGAGSYDKFARFKATVLNSFVQAHGIMSVIEFGCGDGNQLALAAYPDYHGFDVSPTAIQMCRTKFADDASKRFSLIEEYSGEAADLTLSLDVIYHLVEDLVYENYMELLFDAARKFVIIYSSNSDDNSRDFGIHVRHRRFAEWIATNRPAWRFISRIENEYPFRVDHLDGSFADFYIFANSANP